MFYEYAFTCVVCPRNAISKLAVRYRNAKHSSCRDLSIQSHRASTGGTEY